MSDKSQGEESLTNAFTLTPKAGPFFSFAYALLKVAFTKALLALGVGDAWPFAVYVHMILLIL